MNDNGQSLVSARTHRFGGHEGRGHRGVNGFFPSTCK